MRVAITGSFGLIGSALASKLEGRGHEVIRIRRGEQQNELGPGMLIRGFVVG